MKKLLSLLLVLSMLLVFASCGAEDGEKYAPGDWNNGYPEMPDGGNYNDGNYIKGEDDMIMESPSEDAADVEMSPSMDEEDTRVPDATEPQPEIIFIKENDFTKTSEQPVSTFSADVDTASYTYFRKLVTNGYDLRSLSATAGSAIRTEEMVNYFTYNYAAPEGSEVFGKTVSMIKSPWNNETYLLTVGVNAKEVEASTQNNLVFLIDVSGSMSSSDKLPLLKKAFSYLTDNLGSDDRISIVTYAGSERVVLDGCTGNKKEVILNAINNLEAGGSTNGEAGIVKAYQLAEKYFIQGGNNRIIMASDGDLNVGISSPEQLAELVSEKRDSGVFLSVLGFGTGNFRDGNMSALAQNGNGVYHYIDCAAEAERIFSTQLLSTIVTVAKDVKFQLTFDPEYVSEYRLIGYENRMLNTEDFDNDTKDAGEVGSGHTVTVCYELKLNTDNTASGFKIAKLAIRYKAPDKDMSELREYDISSDCYTATPTDDVKFIAAVVETSMIIRDSVFLNAEKNSALGGIISRLDAMDLNAERTEFLNLLKSLLLFGEK